ncbi:triose-phosphate isomerase [Candidatus Microgenomates bacterium]|nr:triose-phosphate isomerase [Candidatus Microgenomates bacterium]
MARKRLIVGNWKMNLTVPEALRFVTDLDKAISASTKAEVVLAPSSMALAPVKDKLSAKFGLAAQNIHYLDHGAFTGEVSATQVRGLADYVLVGHSERRLHFGETNDVVARKVSAVVRNGMTPILCVGENLFERQDNETAQVIHDQLATGSIMLTTREVANLVVAYEPVWAVDSNDIATPEQVSEAIKTVRQSLASIFGKTAAAGVRILYGGHAAPEFVADYLKIKDLDGFLVGRASLNVSDFSAMVKAIQGVRSKA